MQYPPTVVRYGNIQSGTIKWWPTLTLCMELWDVGWVWSVQDVKYCWLENCDKFKDWIHTSSYCNTETPFTLWLMLSDNEAVFRCAWRSRGWDSDENALSQWTVFFGEEFDLCHPDWRTGRSTGWGTPDDSDYKALNNKAVVTIQTREWETTCSVMTGDCTPCWSRMDWGWAR